MTFEEQIVNETINKLLKGDDYREQVLKSINAQFFDFTCNFLKEIVLAKKNNKSISLDWYKTHFINSKKIDPAEAAIFAGVNKKSITNIFGTANKNIVIDVAKQNVDYLIETITNLQKSSLKDFDLSIGIKFNRKAIKLTVVESLIIINALATKKIQIRGGAWSSIGKKVEKPLLDKLCQLSGIPKSHFDNKHFKKDKSKSFDREVDYKLFDKNKKVYRIEVKLMGKGNPESADATIARNSDIFVADTLSQQNKNQLTYQKIKYLILKGNKNPLKDFKKILDELNIPHKK